MDYENNLQMAEEERKLPHDWIAEGNNAYDNGDYIYKEDGFTMLLVRDALQINKFNVSGILREAKRRRL